MLRKRALSFLRADSCLFRRCSNTKGALPVLKQEIEKEWGDMNFFYQTLFRFRGGGYTLEDVQAVVAECPKQRFSLKTSQEVGRRHCFENRWNLFLPREPCSSGLTRAIPSAQWRYLKCYFCVMRGNPFDSFVVFLMEVWMGWRYNLFGDKKWQLRLNWRRWWIHLKHLL